MALQAKDYNILQNIKRAVFKGKPQLLTDVDLNREFELLTTLIDKLYRSGYSPKKISGDTTQSVTPEGGGSFTFTGLLTDEETGYTIEVRGNHIEFGLGTNLITTPFTLLVNQRSIGYLVAEKRLVTFNDDEPDHEISGVIFESGLKSPAADHYILENFSIEWSSVTNNYTSEGKEVICPLFLAATSGFPTESGVIFDLSRGSEALYDDKNKWLFTPANYYNKTFGPSSFSAMKGVIEWLYQIITIGFGKPETAKPVLHSSTVGVSDEYLKNYPVLSYPRNAAGEFQTLPQLNFIDRQGHYHIDRATHSGNLPSDSTQDAFTLSVYKTGDVYKQVLYEIFTDRAWTRYGANATWSAWARVLTSSLEGHKGDSSGVHADLLDGKHGSEFQVNLGIISIGSGLTIEGGTLKVVAGRTYHLFIDPDYPMEYETRTDRGLTYITFRVKCYYTLDPNPDQFGASVFVNSTPAGMWLYSNTQIDDTTRELTFRVEPEVNFIDGEIILRTDDDEVTLGGILITAYRIGVLNDDEIGVLLLDTNREFHRTSGDTPDDAITQIEVDGDNSLVIQLVQGYPFFRVSSRGALNTQAEFRLRMWNNTLPEIVGNQYLPVVYKHSTPDISMNTTADRYNEDQGTFIWNTVYFQNGQGLPSQRILVIENPVKFPEGAAIGDKIGSKVSFPGGALPLMQQNDGTTAIVPIYIFLESHAGSITKNVLDENGHPITISYNDAATIEVEGTLPAGMTAVVTNQVVGDKINKLLTISGTNDSGQTVQLKVKTRELTKGFQDYYSITAFDKLLWREIPVIIFDSTIPA